VGAVSRPADLTRAATGAIGRPQAQPRGNLLLPLWPAEAAASLNALPERFQFHAVVGLIDPRDPIRGPIDRPQRQLSEVRQFTVVLRPEQPLPVVGHQRLLGFGALLEYLRVQECFRPFLVAARLPAGFPPVVSNRAPTSASGSDLSPARRSRIIRQKSSERASSRSSAS